MKKEWVSIDFGTCTTCAARVHGKQVVMVPVRDAPGQGGATYRPTVAYVTKDGEIKTGYAADPYRYSDPDRFFYKFKLDIHNATPLLPELEITYRDLVVAILSDVRDDISADNNGTPIDQVVLTVPALYTEDDPRRALMISAAKAAGFSKVILLSEPEAAALYYRHVTGKSADDLTLVYDLGGGTFDPALIEKSAEGTNLLSIGSGKGLNCGGITFDAAIFQWMRTSIPEVGDLVAVNDKQKLQELRLLSRDLKHLLSTKETVSRPLPQHSGKEVCLTQSDFEEMIEGFLDQTLSCCADLLNSCDKEWSDLTQILLVGGSSHIPLVRRKLTGYLKTVGATDVKVTQTTIDGDARVDPVCAVAAGAAILNYKENEGMNAEIYEQKRNELINLLNDVLAIDELRTETREEIETVKKKSLENNFEIVLVGEFQGGKSTTFNAICDGREISPRGAMIKTSACKISACNLSDPDAEEYAHVTWKSDRDLLMGMIGIIAPHIRMLRPKRFKNATQKQLIWGSQPEDISDKDPLKTKSDDITPLDLQQPEDFELVRQCLDIEWKDYKKRPDSYGQEKLDVLYISSLVAYFIGKPEINDLRERNRMSVYDMGRLVTFPMDWTKRWQSADPAAFQAEEIAFAFVANVRVHIYSPNLARLGCVITDCPGLFTSPWDTEVAQNAMLAADAILYLFGGSKTLDQGDLRALNEIRKVKMEHKLVYAVNVKGKLKHIERNILPENVAKLNAQGFEVTEEDLHLYHALLGLCSRNGKPILENTLDDYSIKRFVQVARTIDEDFSEEADQLWTDLSDEMVANIARRESVEDLSEESIEKVADLSRLDELLQGIEQTVIQKKAHAILVSQGADRASQALSLLEGDLHSRERVAKKTEADFKLAVVTAREKLEGFQSDVKGKVTKLEEQSLHIPLAENFISNVLIDNIESFSLSICDNISSNMFNFHKLLSSFGKKKLDDELRTIIDESIRSVLDPAISGWLTSLNQGDNEIYNTTIQRAVESIEKEIKESWDNFDLQDKTSGLLDGLELDIEEKDYIEKLSLVDQVDFGNLKDNVSKGKVGMIGASISGFIVAPIVYFVVTAIMIAVPIIVFNFLIGIIPLIVVGVIAGSLAATAGGVTGDKIREMVREKLDSKVENEIRTTFGKKETRERMQGISRDLVNTLTNKHINVFKSAMSRQSAYFEERLENAKKDFESSEKERRDLAEKLKVLRETKITPVKSRVDGFMEEVLVLLKK